MELSGGCLCGKLRYRATGPIHSRVHCHCNLCRGASGAPAVSWVTVDRARFEFTDGEPALYRSSSQGERRFCADCGSQLTFWTSRYPDHLDITIGTLDRPEDVVPDHHVWTADRLCWLTLDPDLPGYEEDGPIDV